MVLSSSTRREKGKRRSGSLIVRFLDLFVLLLCSTPGYAHAVPQEQQKESLGSLSSIGEVYVNDSAAPVKRERHAESLTAERGGVPGQLPVHGGTEEWNGGVEFRQRTARNCLARRKVCPGLVDSGAIGDDEN